MKVFAISIFLFFYSFIAAQTESYQNVLNDFQVHFNKGDAQAIFEMMDGPMQQKLGLENITAIVSTFRKNLGPIISYTYLKTEGSQETHETQFENGKQNIVISLNDSLKMSGLRFLPATQEDVVGKMARNTTKMALPFKGEWFTVWGGDTKAQNYHVISNTQKHAFDFLIIGENGRSYDRSGTRNEDYYAFGRPIYAVCDAEVFQVITGVEDNQPGKLNSAHALGNSVILKTNNDEYIVYAHFEKGTVKVKEGDHIKQGQYLGNCGNSGNTTEAHLHLHIQDGPNTMTSVGVKCYFEELLVNGELKTDYSPIRLDRIARPQN